MRELTHEEIEQVSGGGLPILALGKAVFDMVAARTLTSFIGSRIGFVGASIEFGRSMAPDTGSDS